MTLREQQRFTSWSYSRLTLWEQCPLRAKLRHLDKRPEPDSPQMARGSEIHQRAQDYVEHKLASLPDELEPYAAQFRMLRRMKAVCEQQWGFTRTWEPCDWFAQDIWLRVKCDAVYLQANGTLVIVDHKTGNIYDNHKEQLALYAVAGFLHFPVGYIRAEDWYLDQDAILPERFVREDLPAMQRTWEDRARAMLADTLFPARPGPWCKRCAFRKAAGGPCSF